MLLLRTDNATIREFNRAESGNFRLYSSLISMKSSDFLMASTFEIIPANIIQLFPGKLFS